jgi:hypothetical protein
MKDNRIQNSLKAETPGKPEGCTVKSEITEKPVRLFCIVTRGSSASLYHKKENNGDNRKTYKQREEKEDQKKDAPSR